MKFLTIPLIVLIISGCSSTLDRYMAGLVMAQPEYRLEYLNSKAREQAIERCTRYGLESAELVRCVDEQEDNIKLLNAQTVNATKTQESKKSHFDCTTYDTLSGSTTSCR